MSLARDHGLFPYINPDLLSLTDLIALEMHRPDGLEGIVFHRMQAKVYRDLMDGRNVILSAPTSFGKSLIVDALIASGRYRNVVLIVPTIALIDETRRRLSQKFPDFKTITHPGQAYEDKNLFVLTQERFLALEEAPAPDLFFVDEFYKLNDFGNRAALLNQAIYRLMKTGAQFYMAAPNISALSGLLPVPIQTSLVITDYATVAADTETVKAKNDVERRAAIKNILATADGPALIYCQSPQRVRQVTRWLREDAPTNGYGPGMPAAADWIADNYDRRWSLSKNLRLGIGSHHGKLPRWLAQLVVEGFNDKQLGVLVCTNTLIEGVNTRAKNILILDKKIASKAYDYFTFSNIRGRGGRMLKHFVGKIFLFHPPPETELPSIDIPGLSQSDRASDALLLSIDEPDRTPTTKQRLKDVVNQQVLSVDVMRQNQGIDPEQQLALAKHLAKLPHAGLVHLQWNTSHPTYNQLKSVVALVWDFLPPLGNQRHLARSAEQLTLLVWRVARVEGDIKAVIEQLVTSSDDDDYDYDQAIEDCFDFLRFWIDHNLPTLIRAIDRISKEVLQRRGLSPGSFVSFAARMEAGFQPPLLMVAEEYGIPVQVSKKLLRYSRANEDLDALMQGFKALDLERIKTLMPFEKEIVERALGSL
ncbi:hypothetical protein LJR013_003911 [Pseudarthrobacter oxydans]|uniref:DEAD/DEAH box helicase n=1 Tax=Pseudarthrobacter oxydans TaxID=1671 RepID=UPI003ECCF241